jgi:nucleotidyltransferase substrate binding protein (TIGR01987 family)
MGQRELSKLEKQGVIHGFKYCYELGWNTLKDFLVWQGIDGIVGSRDTVREAFSKGLISDGHAWMQMLTDRNRTSHTYNEETAEAILTNIRVQHHACSRPWNKPWPAASSQAHEFPQLWAIEARY